MKLKSLSKSDENLMLDLLRSERESKDTDFYLDRGSSFWGLYNWFSHGENIGMGVFEGEQMVGMAAVVKLPFKFQGSSQALHLATDMLIHPDFRKSFAAARIMTGLHTFLPPSEFIEICIENKPGFAEVLPKISARHGYSTLSPRQTNLTTIYPNQKYEIVDSKSNFEINQDWSKIRNQIKLYQSKISSWINLNNQIELENVFKSIHYFKFASSDSEISGLLIDRSNLQKILWNGQARLLIEKYRRSLAGKSIPLQQNDELPFQSVCFVTSSNNSISSDALANIGNWGFENKYFGINIRDIGLSLPATMDRASFPRRIFLSADQGMEKITEVVSRNAGKDIFLESIYL